MTLRCNYWVVRSMCINLASIINQAFRAKSFIGIRISRLVEDGMPRMRAVSCSVSLSGNNEYNGPLMLIPESHQQFIACVGKTPDNQAGRSCRNSCSKRSGRLCSVFRLQHHTRFEFQYYALVPQQRLFCVQQRSEYAYRSVWRIEISSRAHSEPRFHTRQPALMRLQC